MSDLELHTKALDLLIDYYEVEKWSPNVDESNILVTNIFVISELRCIREHIRKYHEGIRSMELVDLLTINIILIAEDDKNFRAWIYDKATEV